MNGSDVQNLINASGGGLVQLPPGDITVAQTIYVPSRVRLHGAAATPDELPSQRWGGTRLIAQAGLSGPVIRTEGTAPNGAVGSAAQWWHTGEIAYLMVEGNQLALAGIHAGHMGEACSIHHVYVSHAAGDGILLDDGTPSCLENCSAFDNGGAGFHLRGNDRPVTLLNPSGDRNRTALIHLSAVPSQYNLSSVVIINPKAERAGDGTTHDPAILLDNWAGNCTILGGSLDGSGYATGAAIRRTGAAVGPLWVQGTRTAYYPVQFDDQARPTASVAIGPYTYTFGASL